MWLDRHFSWQCNVTCNLWFFWFVIGCVIVSSSQDAPSGYTVTVSKIKPTSNSCSHCHYTMRGSFGNDRQSDVVAAIESHDGVSEKFLHLFWQFICVFSMFCLQKKNALHRPVYHYRLAVSRTELSALSCAIQTACINVSIFFKLMCCRLF